MTLILQWRVNGVYCPQDLSAVQRQTARRSRQFDVEWWINHHNGWRSSVCVDAVLDQVPTVVLLQ